MPQEKAGHKLCIGYIYLTFVIFILLGSITVHSSKNITNITVDRSGIQEEVQADWIVRPFVSLSVQSISTTLDDYGCATGEGHVFERIWYGTTQGCDCTGVTDPYSEESTWNTVNLDTECTDSQKQYGCTYVPAWPAIRMSTLTDVSGNLYTVCGKYGGLPF